MPTHYTGTLTAGQTIGGNKLSFIQSSLLVPMRGVTSLGSGEFEVDLTGNERTQGDFKDLSDTDRLRFKLANSAGALRIETLMGGGGSGAVKTITGNLAGTHNWHFISDGDAVTPPSYFYVISDTIAGAVGEVAGAGLAIRMLKGYTDNLEIASVDAGTKLITLKTNTEVPAAWLSEIGLRGAISLTIVGQGTSPTSEVVSIDAISTVNPPTLHYVSLSGSIPNSFIAGSRIGKLALSMYAMDRSGASFIGAAATYKLAIANGGALIAPTATEPAQATGVLLDTAKWVNFGLPGLVAIPTAGFSHLDDTYFITPDQTKYQSAVVFDAFTASWSAALATSRWRTIAT